MTATLTVILEGTFATSDGVGRVSDNRITTIDKLTATNESAALASATVQFISPDGALTHSITKAIQPGATWPFPEAVGHVIDRGGKVNVTSTAANAIKVRISGRDFT